MEAQDPAVGGVADLLKAAAAATATLVADAPAGAAAAVLEANDAVTSLGGGDAALRVEGDLYTASVTWFFVLLALLLLFRRQVSLVGTTQQARSIVVTADFQKFQRTFLLVYLLAMGADWLQGPYVYALYKVYGFDMGQIGLLFIVGFGSSLVFGTVVGSASDKYGRKMLCLCFGVLYSISCLTKHFNNYNVLLCGRLLGGISTSILFSSFEAWMVHEHHELGYPEDWLSMTFARMTSLNGVTAIGAGVVASFCFENIGPVAPFDASLLCLVACTVIIGMNWKENVGDAQIDLRTTLYNAMHRLYSDKKIALLGLIQSLYEGAMYIFVFMWTPALESTADGRKIYHGWIFACFMICTLIGSQLFTALIERQYRVERSAVWMFGAAVVSLGVPMFVSNHWVRLISFFLFEITCGMFWPTLGTMRSRYVPEEVRATVMNFFRIPLNAIVVIILANIDRMAELTVFGCCCGCLLVSLLLQLQLVSLTIESPDIAKKANIADGAVGGEELKALVGSSQQ